MQSILYVGCPPAERAEAERTLGAAELSVVWADNAASALTELQRCQTPVLVDLSAGSTGLEQAREIRRERAATLLVAVADAQQPETTTEAVLAGMADIIARPLNGRRVAAAIERELRPSAILSSETQADEDSGDLYCHSIPMRHLVVLIAKAAATKTGVLLRGEEGTGRRIVARSIHASQSTRRGPFIGVDCAAVDAERLENALFGAPARRQDGNGSDDLEPVETRSLLVQASGGTLYLKNIAEAPARVQARLARALRDGEGELAQTGQTLTLDVRPMASVDPGFEDVVRDGRVREDLLRRLSATCIDLPALRNRREDIPALANYFVRQICAARGVPARSWTRSALCLIGALPWRGNAAELRSLLEHVVRSTHGSSTIALEDLLPHVRLDAGAAASGAAGTLRQARARFEREYIAAVLERHHGRISEAAQTLGIRRTNLYRKIRSLKVSGARSRNRTT